jgi:hypothetical protein
MVAAGKKAAQRSGVGVTVKMFPAKPEDQASDGAISNGGGKSEYRVK